MDNLVEADLRNASPAGPELRFHAQESEEFLRSVESSLAGLTAYQAAKRLSTHGPNELPDAVGVHPVLRFFAHFNNALISFLIAAAVATALLGHFVDTSVILAIVIANAIVRFVQEGKAEKSLKPIRNLVSAQAHVLRDERRERITAGDLVPGDIVILKAGDRVPADLRLVQASSLLIEEAILTGESGAAEKLDVPVPTDAVLGDWRSMAYSGTFSAAAQASGVVVATGLKTEIGRISTLLRSVETLMTPLARQFDNFGRGFTYIALAVSAALFKLAVTLRGYAWTDALLGYTRQSGYE